MTPISQKAHDISYAAFRCAKVMSNRKLSKELENAAIDLLSGLNNIESLDFRNSKLEISNPVDNLERLISFSESIGELKTMNAIVLRRELNNLQAAIKIHLEALNGKPENPERESLDISGMFVASDLPNGLSDSLKPVSINPIEIKNSVIKPSIEISNSKLETSDVDIEGKSNSLSISDRQATILRFVREIPFCRMRNILELMPNVSERTIRNDIQVLIEAEQVRRVGGGGPNSYFESLEVTIPQRSNLPASR